MICWKNCEAEALIEEGHAISEPRHLFSRIEDEVIQRQVEKLKQPVEVATSEATQKGHMLS